MYDYAILYDSNKEADKAFSVIKKSDEYSSSRFHVYLPDLDEDTAKKIMHALNKQ